MRTESTPQARHRSETIVRSGSNRRFQWRQITSVVFVGLALVIAVGACVTKNVPAGAAGASSGESVSKNQVRKPAPTSTAPSFDADRAFNDLSRQVGFGPRVPGMSSHRACRDYLEASLKQMADQIERQEFVETVSGKKLSMCNLIARWKGTQPATPGALLIAHWDTRPTADQERVESRRSKPIPGANDGASGVAVLLEIARGLKRTTPPIPVMILLVDGEDYGPGVDQMFLGSRYFAAHLPRDVPQRGILLDMVGDKHLQIPQEAYSVRNAGDVVSEVYASAQKLGYQQQFPNRIGPPIEDDHLPLQAKSLKVIDLIDFDYGPGHSWWHTLADTPDKCSPNSLRAVGETVLDWLYSR